MLNVSINGDSFEFSTGIQDQRIEIAFDRHILHRTGNSDTVPAFAADRDHIDLRTGFQVKNTGRNGNIFVTGNGTLLKVDITGDGAYVSTVGTDVTGKNNYVPPAPVGGIRDLGGLHIVIGDWYSNEPEVAVTEEQLAQEQLLDYKYHAEVYAPEHEIPACAVPKAR